MYVYYYITQYVGMVARVDFYLGSSLSCANYVCMRNCMYQ